MNCTDSLGVLSLLAPTFGEVLGKVPYMPDIILIVAVVGVTINHGCVYSALFTNLVNNSQTRFDPIPIPPSLADAGFTTQAADLHRNVCARRGLGEARDKVIGRMVAV